jgi:hypothetical protein
MLGLKSATMTLELYGHVFEGRFDFVAGAPDAARSRSLVARPSPMAEIVDLGKPREMTAPPEVRGV